MGTAIKKVGKKTFFSLLSVSAFIVAFFFRMFLGSSHINLSQLESKASDVFSEENKIISTARADAPSSGCAGSEGCGSSGGCEGSSGGTDGSGDGSGDSG